MTPPSAVLSEMGVHTVTATSAVTNRSPLTVSGVAARRAKSAPLKAGIAAAASSDMFKGKAPWKPMAKRWDHRLSTESKSRKPSSLKGAAKYLATPGMISLGGGLPSSDYFPFHQLDVKVPALGHFMEEETAKNGVTISIGKHDTTEGKSAFDLAIALNYGQGTGSAQLLRWITEHTEIIHNPPYQDWHCITSVGSTSSLEIVFRMFLERGDYLLTEEFAFSSAVETALPMGAKMCGIKLDDEGLIPEHLDEILSNWDEEARGARKPFLLYTVPSGHNPTGATQGTERRKAIYAVAQKHDMIIVEDEPYYFLQMDPYQGAGAPPVPAPASHEEFLKALVPSFVRLDTDGRVIRLDSFSKVISPGSRIGWAVLCEQLAERMVRHNEVSVQNPAGFSQIILYKLLDEQWGHAGYLDWLIHMRSEYTSRRNVILNACEKYLPKPVVSWTPPAAGMFLWLKLDGSKHPQYGKQSLHSIEQEIFRAAIENKVLVSPGSWFSSERDVPITQLFFRATFAAAQVSSCSTPGNAGNIVCMELFNLLTYVSRQADAMVEAIRRFGQAVRKAFEL
ncbi:aromatic amino acid aminotransferas-like protein [Kalaharituber pfeilii]|nr:aromatic amino acid aminotransferas-like protein [Kalaharituber pfeilii]